MTEPKDPQGFTIKRPSPPPPPPQKIQDLTAPPDSDQGPPRPDPQGEPPSD